MFYENCQKTGSFSLFKVVFSVFFKNLKHVSSAVRTLKRTSEEDIENFDYQDGGCCRGKKVVCATLAVFQREDILKSRRIMASASKLTRIQIVKTLARNSMDEETGHLKYFSVGSHKLCLKAFCSYHNISASSLYVHSRSDGMEVANGYTERDHPKSGPAIAWLETHIKELADTNPLGTNYVLPMETLTRKELWEKYLFDNALAKNLPEVGEDGLDLPEVDEDGLSLSRWYRILQVRTVFIVK